MSGTASLAFFLIATGAAVGSFLAAWADRLPRGESIVGPRSRCQSCAGQIGWRDMAPVLSWLWLGGKCRSCGAAIPKRLFYAELGGMALAVLAVWVAESPLHMVLGAGWLWVLMGLVLCDLAAFRLPDGLTGPLFLIGILLAWEDPSRDLWGALIGAAVGAGTFMALRIGYQTLRGREGLGWGDVKLMAGIGAGLGVMALPVVTLVAAVLAMAVAGITALRRGARPDGDLAIAFGAYLAGAAGLVWIWSLI
ncbi:prepilin peptidase [Roseovarius sp. 217]|uniref:prepilin peptidase n=1 Tax=Roseovarius sp. (strain 217) TaxID=314264 RepID=UPI0000684930|nr:A24 family peptidase [Roseovarius sp. 217]EAQ25960.1 Peptidase A24A-like [Roseovarius sp. 217]